MASFEVDVRDTLVLLQLKNAAKRQRYAIANAINTTLLAIQRSIPGHLKQAGFVIRKTQFFFGSSGQRGGVANKINRYDFAKPVPGMLRGRISIEASSVNSQRRLLLPAFETGGVRRPMTPGAKHVAVPILGSPARPSIAQGVPPEYTFAGLKFKAYRDGRKLTRRTRGHVRDVTVFGEFGVLRLPGKESALQWKGQHRTFLLPTVHGAEPGGVFQRIGPARGDVRLLYAFVQNPQLPASLHYVRNAQRVVAAVFKPALMAEVEKTLAFHSQSIGSGGSLAPQLPQAAA